MSLDTICREPATYSAKLLGVSGRRSRQGSPVQEFLLCENHSQLVAQVDKELIEEGWSAGLVQPPTFLL